jgi:hypothetical protein
MRTKKLTTLKAAPRTVRFCTATASFTTLRRTASETATSPAEGSLERLLALRPEGIFVNPLECGEIGPDLFRTACRMGLEGLVSKRRDHSYRGGRSKDWVKMKNRKHPQRNA